MNEEVKRAWIAALDRVYRRHRSGLADAVTPRLLEIFHEKYVIPVCERKSIDLSDCRFRAGGSVTLVEPAILTPEMTLIEEVLCYRPYPGGPAFGGLFGYRHGLLRMAYVYARPEQGFKPFVMVWDDAVYWVAPSPFQVIFDVNKDGVPDGSEYAQELALLCLNWGPLRGER